MGNECKERKLLRKRSYFNVEEGDNEEQNFQY